MRPATVFQVGACQNRHAAYQATSFLIRTPWPKAVGSRGKTIAARRPEPAPNARESHRQSHLGGAEGKEQDGQAVEEDEPVVVGVFSIDGPVGGGGPFVLGEPAGVGGGGTGREKTLGTQPVTISRRGARSETW